MLIVGGVAFVATTFFGEPIKLIGTEWYSNYRASRDAPSAIVCAPLQEARVVVRQSDRIIHDGQISHPAPVTVVFRNNKQFLNDFSLLIYPLGSHNSKPKVYSAKLEGSDLTSGSQVTMNVDGGAILIRAPNMPPNEVLILEAMYGQPVSIILEARANDYANEFHAIAGCPNVNESFSTPPTVLLSVNGGVTTCH